MLGAAGDLLGHDHVGRQHEGHALRLGQGQDAGRVLHPVTFEQALADGPALGHQEGVGHAAADDEGVDAIHEVLEDPELVRDLGTADDGRERLGRRLEQRRERDDLALHEQAGVGRQVGRHADRRGVGTMRRAEGIVDVDVGIGRQRLRELGVVGLLLGVEAQVLEQDRLARLEAGDGVDGADAERVAGHAHGSAQQVRQAQRDRTQAEGVVDLALRPTEMAGQDDDGAAIEEVGDGRHAGPDAGVVDDLAVLERDVEIDPDEDLLAGRIEVANGELVHGSTVAFD